MGDNGLLFGGVARIVFSFYKWVANNDDPDDPVWPLFGLRVPLRRSRSLNVVSLPLPTELSPQSSQSQYDHKSWFKMAIIDISLQQLTRHLYRSPFPPRNSEFSVFPSKSSPLYSRLSSALNKSIPSSSVQIIFFTSALEVALPPVPCTCGHTLSHPTLQLTICWRGFLKCKPIFVAEVCKIVRKDKSWYFSFLWTDTDSNYL